MLKEVYRLSNIQEDKDIKSLSKAQFPGPHCPLFGAIMTASYIEDLMLLIIGTEECTYYGKDFAMMRQKGKDQVYSAVLEQHDITFGCEEDLREIILKIDREEKPKALMIITTCVVELIGEDVSSILHSLRDEVNTKLLIVKTEHFKCNSHIDGMEKAYAGLASLMEPKKENTVNILGFKYDGVEETELYQLLNDHGVEVAMTIPTKVTIDAMTEATSSVLNIVVDATAIGLAKAMKTQFQIPYVAFGMGLDLDGIANCYKSISQYLNMDVQAIIQDKYHKAAKLMEAAGHKLQGKTFIYGNTPFDCFAFSEFLMELGMEPMIIQCREFLSIHEEVRRRMLQQHVNPYVLRMANIAPLRRIYGELQPDYYFGHENPIELSKHNITQIVTDSCAKKIGFEKVTAVIDAIQEEKSLFSLMGETRDDKESDDQVKDKIEKLTNMPAPMKKMLLNMKSIPDAMKEALLTLDNNAPLESMMQKQGAHMATRRS